MDLTVRSVGPLTAGPLCGAEPGSSLLMRHHFPPSSFTSFISSSFYTSLSLHPLPPHPPSLPLFSSYPLPFHTPSLCFVPPSRSSSCLLSSFYPPLLSFIFPQLLPCNSSRASCATLLMLPSLHLTLPPALFSPALPRISIIGK